MDLKGILSISGYGGLFKLITQAKNGIIVESLETKKRMPAYASSKISALEDIAIFCEDEDIQLTEVLKNIYKKEDGGKAISHKSPNSELKKYFEEVLPEYDKERVYVSDIKRVLNWYNILNDLKMIDLEDPKEEDNKEEQKDSDSKPDTAEQSSKDAPEVEEDKKSEEKDSKEE